MCLQCYISGHLKLSIKLDFLRSKDHIFWLRVTSDFATKLLRATCWAILYTRCFNNFVALRTFGTNPKTQVWPQSLVCACPNLCEHLHPRGCLRWQCTVHTNSWGDSTSILCHKKFYRWLSLCQTRIWVPINIVAQKSIWQKQSKFARNPIMSLLKLIRITICRLQKSSMHAHNEYFETVNGD